MIWQAIMLLVVIVIVQLTGPVVGSKPKPEDSYEGEIPVFAYTDVMYALTTQLPKQAESNQTYTNPTLLLAIHVRGEKLLPHRQFRKWEGSLWQVIFTVDTFNMYFGIFERNSGDLTPKWFRKPVNLEESRASKRIKGFRQIIEESRDLLKEDKLVRARKSLHQEVVGLGIAAETLDAFKRQLENDISSWKLKTT